ncbi:MAG TPA: glycosyltransferase [Vicinamibacterales bacterium]|nr:glycosyltransferase [Vicinamibacterales bacterium]
MRRRVLLVQPSMQPPGGGNGVAAWMLQALAADHDVTVLSWSPVDVAPINRFFGTSLRGDDFVTHVVPRSWRSIPDLLPVPAALLRSSLLMRYTRRVIDGFDVIVGVHNETDYGRRGIQYVHYPSYLRPRPEVDLRWYHRSAPLLNAYYSAADRLAGFSLERMKANLTLANSDWTASRLQRFLGIDAVTLYPPVLAAGPQSPWHERRRGFVMMGRISPEKEYERAMRILARVRAHASDTTLTIIGTWDARTEGYYSRLVALARSLDPAGAWITFRRDLSRDEVRVVLTTTRYGIHGMREEHFGMAPAEMVGAGMIVWVPDGGGQVEIVGDAPLLRYDDEDQAVDQILRVVSDEAEERRLRDQLAAQGERFSTERFVREIRTIVETFRG